MKHNDLMDQILIHKCNVNHSSSSGSMESKLVLSIVTDICSDINRAANIGKLVTDDDSTMRANLKRKTERNKGKVDET